MRDNSIAKWITWGVAGIIALILLCSSIYYIRPGYRGVLITLGKVDEKVYANGVGFKWPFISSMEKIDVRTVEMTDETYTFTSDIQNTTIKFTFTYSLVPGSVAWIYENVGEDYYTKKIKPFLIESMKNVIGTWQAQDVVNHRAEVGMQITQALREKLDPNLFRDITFSLVDVDYSDDFEKAIEAKVIAEQKAQEARNNTARIEEEAKQKVIAAEAEAKAMKIQAQALASNPKLTEYEAVKKWDGKMPTYMMGGSTPLVQLPLGK